MLKPTERRPAAGYDSPLRFGELAPDSTRQFVERPPFADTRRSEDRDRRPVYLLHHLKAAPELIGDHLHVPFVLVTGTGKDLSVFESSRERWHFLFWSAWT
jgi:hypothetical protein